MSNPDSKDLTDRKIIITGAASGIGHAVAKLFAERGCTLALMDLNTNSLAEFRSNHPAFTFEVDVSNESAVTNAVNQAAEKMGGIDGVVNAAGIIRLGSLSSTTFADWQRQLDVNVTGSFLVCRAALPWLEEASSATIVNIASAQALRPAGASAGYAASKAALVVFSKAIAAELAPSIRVNVICPGIVDTPMVQRVNQNPDKPPTTPNLSDYALGRMADAKEIASAVLFLSNNDSSFITGIAMAVDGGRSFH